MQLDDLQRFPQWQSIWLKSEQLLLISREADWDVLRTLHRDLVIELERVFATKSWQQEPLLIEVVREVTQNIRALEQVIQANQTNLQNQVAEMDHALMGARTYLDNQ